MIRIAVVAQALAMRAGLRSLLEAGDAVEVVAEAATLAELMPVLPEIEVLVLAASRLPAELQLGRLRELPSSEAPPPVLLLSSERSAVQIMTAILSPAWGVLPLEASAEELQAAVAALHEGLIVVSPSLAQPALSRLVGMAEAEAEPLIEPLTERERQVLQLLAQGLANKQIAASLGISEHTVKFHVSGIYAKLGAASRTEAVRRGVQQGLVIL